MIRNKKHLIPHNLFDFNDYFVSMIEFQGRWELEFRMITDEFCSI